MSLSQWAERGVGSYVISQKANHSVTW